MLFNSFNFFVFYIVVFCVYWSIRRHDAARILFLLAASLFFYMSWNWRYVGLMFFTITLNFFTGLGIAGTESLKRKKMLLLASVVGSLSVLVLFKYYNFFTTTTAEVFSIFGLSFQLKTLNLLLPVGISFYTFHCLSYTVDVYRNEFKPTRNFLFFALYVSFFPQLIAGPIVRGRELLPQLERPVHFDDQRTLSGLWLIFVGLFKKVCVADILAVTFVDKVFGAPHQYVGAQMLLAVYGYAIQIYCDFSGYSDIAIGVARTLGYELPVNFRTPYLAESIQDFWRRWHITLSTWLRDYLYISLGGSRSSRWKVFRNLMITMLLGGLWHGAALNFVIWGGYHGVLLSLSHLLKGNKKDEISLLRKVINIFVTFNLVCFGWILFRSPDMATFTAICRGLLNWQGHWTGLSWVSLTALAAGFAIIFTPKELKGWLERQYISMPTVFQGVAYSGALAVFTVFSAQNVPFIYFQF